MPAAVRLINLAFAVAGAMVALPALAADDEFRLVIQDHKCQPAELVGPAGKQLKLVVENRDPTAEEFESKTLSREKVVAGKASITISIGPLKPGRYPFVGEYHEATAQGVLVAQ